MTKHIRVENADISPRRVRVRVFEKAGLEGAPDHLMGEWFANNPCDVVEQYIHASRYVVVDEV